MPMTYGGMIEKYRWLYNGKLDQYNCHGKFPFELYSLNWGCDEPRLLLKNIKHKIWISYTLKEIEITVPSLRTALVFKRPERWNIPPTVHCYLSEYDPETDCWDIDPDKIPISDHTVDEEMDEKFENALLAPWNE